MPVEGLDAKPGDLVQLVGLGHKTFLVTLSEGAELHTHRGVLKHDDIIGRPWGSAIFSHNGSPFFLLQPSMFDLVRSVKRATQIMYPKEIAYLLLYMGIKSGSRVIEAGTGSGSMTTAIANAVGDAGRVYSYEKKVEIQEVAKQSIGNLGFSDRVEFYNRDIHEGFNETNVDALFLDLPNPFDYLGQVRQALKPGGHLGCILPTMNQVVKLLVALKQNNFAFVEICDISVRFYKTEPTRFRPVDRMIAHTGYLIFARPILIENSLSEEIMQDLGIDIEGHDINHE